MSSAYILISCPETAEICQFDTEEDLVAKLQSLKVEDAKVPNKTRHFVIAGERARFTKGEPKYLVLPNGNKHSLTKEPDTLEYDDEGFLVDMPSVDLAETSELPEDTDTVTGDEIQDVLTFEEDLD